MVGRDLDGMHKRNLSSILCICHSLTMPVAVPILLATPGYNALNLKGDSQYRSRCSWPLASCSEDDILLRMLRCAAKAGGAKVTLTYLDRKGCGHPYRGTPSEWHNREADRRRDGVIRPRISTRFTFGARNKAPTTSS